MHPHINILIRAGILIVLIFAFVIIRSMTDPHPAEKHPTYTEPETESETHRTTDYPSRPLFDSSESESQTPTF